MKGKDIQTNLLAMAPALLACAAVVALIGCGSGSGSSGGATYTVGGTLAGLGAGQSVSLQDNAGDSLTLNANGTFSFPMSLDSGSTYIVTEQSHTPGIGCSVSNGNGTVGSSDVTGIDVSCAAGTETILYSFGGSTDDGFSPTAGVVIDGAGNLYGTTLMGGTSGGGSIGGTVFKIGTSGKESILYSFDSYIIDGQDGQNPYAGLIMDGAGNLYGTTRLGGLSGYGTVFKIGPSSTETILYSFGAGANGYLPQTSLIMDSVGNLYGTTQYGGANGDGTIYKIGPSGGETVLHSFGASATDGVSPGAGLTADSAGNLYGTTFAGGANGNGTVFKFDTSGTETILYSFGAGAIDGQGAGGLIMDSAGNLYGMTGGDGVNNSGTVFKISSSGEETILYSFGASATDGKNPSGNLIMDSAGNLYGTTALGGANGFGAVFRLSASGAETILYSFGASATDGQEPLGGLIVDSSGNLYGTTDGGGARGFGTVFKID